MLIAAALLGLSYLSVIVNPAKVWWMTVFGLLFVPAALLNLFLFVWAIYRKSRAVLIPAVALLPAALFAGLYFQYHPSGEREEPAGDATDVKIVSYNVGRFRCGASDMTPQASADSIVDFLNSTDADIICLQEFHLDNVTDIKKWFAKRFKGYYLDYYVYTLRSGRVGNIILSRFPFKGKGKIEFDNSTNLALYGDCSIGGRNLRIYNCHFQSYSLSVPHLAKSIREDYREAVKYTENKMKSSVPIRAGQVDIVMKHIEECPTEAVVTGDFNDNPLSYTYYRLSRGRRDSFREAGNGFGATYYAFRPFLRIDYVLCPESVQPVGHEVVHNRFSDHYPVVATLRI